MGEQTMIQIRVDSQLKEDAAEVFERIGIDIPTAVRMFFKAAVREQRLPFSTNVAEVQKVSEADKLMEYFKGMVMYEPPIIGDDESCVAVMPLENGRDIPSAMYVQLLMKVPVGRITCWEDIFAFLGKIYGRQVSGFPDRPLPHIDTERKQIPYWRVVSSKGVLGDGRGGSKESQKEQLIKEGIPVIQRGSIEGSYRVENYKEYMFDFRKLKVNRDN